MQFFPILRSADLLAEELGDLSEMHDYVGSESPSKSS